MCLDIIPAMGYYLIVINQGATTMQHEADFEASAKRDGISVTSNMCRRCIRHAEADGWKVRKFTASVAPCDWCNAETSLVDFHPPYVYPCTDEPSHELVTDDVHLYFTNPCLTYWERNSGVY